MHGTEVRTVLGDLHNSMYAHAAEHSSHPIWYCNNGFTLAIQFCATDDLKVFVNLIIINFSQAALPSS